MGADAQAYLAYGYDLGGQEYGWNVHNELAIERIKAEGDDDFADGVKNILLKRLVGFKVEDRDIDKFYEKLNAAKKQLEVELVNYSSWEYPGYILAVTPVHWAFDWTPITVDIALDHQAAMKLDMALRALELRPTQEEPKWILAPFYG